MALALADLHTHTTFSDGRLTPPGLVEKASLRGLAALAITDHDTVGGYALGAAAAARSGVALIPGVELSADVDGQDVHLLGFGFDPRDVSLRSHLAEYRAGRLVRARAMVERLAALGAPVSFERVLEIAGGGAVGRPHVARAVVEAGHVETMGQVFEHYLGDGAPAYVAKPPVPPATLIELLHRAGGIAVVAHPGDAITKPMVRELAAAGLDGIETVHPAHDDALTAYWSDVAAELDLITTGGSDYHGYRPGEEVCFGSFGVGRDTLGWLDRCWAGG